ncbi:hypothetical protein ACHAWF_007730, partial [Thalassiosira exigua]
ARFEQFLFEHGCAEIKHLHSDNGVFSAEEFRDEYAEKKQTQSFSGVGAQHQLSPNQILRAESGAMLYVTEGVTMETSMGLDGAAGGGGFAAGMIQTTTGQNLTVSDFRYDGSSRDGHGAVGLGTDSPAKILRFDLSRYPKARLVCQKGAFLAGSHTVAMEVAFAKSFASGFFGGEGFALQSLRATTDAPGETAFLKAYGTVVEKELKEGETLRVSSGSLVCMTSAVDFDVATMPGFKNVMFGGEGLFVTTLTGPGTVWLQGMPVDRMVSEIARKVPIGGIGLGIPIGLGGGVGEGAAEGAEGAGDVAAGTGEGASEAGDGEADGGVPATDAAVDADRNATVASSGASSSSSPPPDAESPEALFGDAAHGGEGSAPDFETDSGEMDVGSTFSTDEPAFSTDEFSQPDSTAEFVEPKIEDPFEDDGTTFSTYEGSDSPEGGGDAPSLPGGDEEGPGLLGQLWEFFKDMNDD